MKLKMLCLSLQNGHKIGISLKPFDNLTFVKKVKLYISHKYTCQKIEAQCNGNSFCIKQFLYERVRKTQMQHADLHLLYGPNVVQH